jgi:exopolyphosphatase/guanosine-5'-triphosphate,3'-diphosphate pyrophosphatase
MILAGIDIGTNSLRLLIAATGPGSFREIISDRRITRLGQDLDRRGVLSPEAEERSLHALVDFQNSIRQHGVSHTSAIGTSALRKAANSSAFIDHVRKRTGIVVRIITGEEEARLTLLGVEQSLAVPDEKHSNAPASALVIDIGGGSTEIIITHRDKNPVIASLPLGAVYLTDQFLLHDPPTVEELNSLRRAVQSQLDRYLGAIRPPSNSIFVGTAGTITTLAAIDQGLVQYDPEKINGSVLTREFVDNIVLKLSTLTLKERKTIRGLEPGREDIILAGAVVAQEIMHRFGFPSIRVSDWGLREGIVIDLFERLCKRESDINGCIQKH